MPPRRATKRTAAGPGNRRAVRGRAAGTVSEEVEVKEGVRVEEENPTLGVEEKESEPEEEVNIVEEVAEENGVASPKKDDDAKEPDDEYEKDERLDLEDNDPEYEPEEDGGVCYDEKEVEQDAQEQGDVEEEAEEADVGEEEEGNVVEEGMAEELDPQEEDEHIGEEHAEIVDAAEEEEHHEIVNERRKRKEFEVFVGGLDKDATENDLRKLFEEVGEITEVRLQMNSQTKKNKGFAFLRFATVEQAKRACTQLKNPVVNGRQCGVSPCQDNDTLFLGNICKAWTKDALKEKLKHYGVDSTEDLILVEDGKSVGLNRGFAFLEFASRSDAMDAFKRLQKRDVMFGEDRPVKVSFADSFLDPGDEIMAQVKTVFLDGISASWDDDHVKELLKIYGKIEKVELAHNMPSARRKDFGFVTFETHDAAVTCAKCINNEELGEGDNKAKVRARLSRPHQRGKGKHVGRGNFRPGRGSTRGFRSPRGRPFQCSVPLRGPRGIRPRIPPVMGRGSRRPVSIRDRRPFIAVSPSRPVAPLPRAYDRRPPVPAYPKSGLNWNYGYREDRPPRSRAATDYGSRVSSNRRPSYREDYAPRGSGYPDLPRGGTSRSTARRSYADDGYSQRYERPPSTHREGRGREYDSTSGSKRAYVAMDDVPPRYAEAGVRHSRARLDHDLGSSGSNYGDAYSDRLRRSNLEYGGSRSFLSSQDSRGFYGSRQDIGHSGGSYGGGDSGGTYTYSLSFGGDYMARGGDVGGSCYSSPYSGRGLGGNSYMGSGSSGSYY
ncbi:hypothetical protein ACJIZ3_016505 [Penstemon smallii]|uniref:RRM domain-containing protein n=1 Tax=Penstemon smallii TaxID=265156 RepID=A0ABD3RQK6_9LAMI